MSVTGYGVYVEAQAKELDQARLILMMYAGAINFLNRALETKQTDTFTIGDCVSRAKSVILELMSSLNLEEGGEMGVILFRTYQGLFNKLNIAHMQDDMEEIAEVRDSLAELEDAWKQVFMNDEYREFKDNRELFRLRYSTM